MRKITDQISLNDSDFHCTFTLSQGKGGQHVNKVATAAQLRFNIMASSLPLEIKERLISFLGKRVTSQGDLLIKASTHRTQERNKQDAINRLINIIKYVAKPVKKRKKTRPTKASIEARLNKKKRVGEKKSLRQKRE